MKRLVLSLAVLSLCGVMLIAWRMEQLFPVVHGVMSGEHISEPIEIHGVLTMQTGTVLSTPICCVIEGTEVTSSITTSCDEYENFRACWVAHHEFVAIALENCESCPEQEAGR